MGSVAQTGNIFNQKERMIHAETRRRCAGDYHLFSLSHILKSLKIVMAGQVPATHNRGLRQRVETAVMGPRDLPGDDDGGVRQSDEHQHLASASLRLRVNPLSSHAPLSAINSPA
jgi:hypothetical protein